MKLLTWRESCFVFSAVWPVHEWMCVSCILVYVDANSIRPVGLLLLFIIRLAFDYFDFRYFQNLLDIYDWSFSLQSTRHSPPNFQTPTNRLQLRTSEFDFCTKTGACVSGISDLFLYFMQNLFIFSVHFFLNVQISVS